MDVTALKYTRQLTLLDRITVMLKTMDQEDLEVVLQKFVDSLDELDQDDFFGTQGWKYLTGDDE